MPSEESQTEAYRVLAEPTTSFESTAATLGFAPAGTASLTTYVNDVLLHCWTRRRQELLRMARDVVCAVACTRLYRRRPAQYSPLASSRPFVLILRVLPSLFV